MLMLRCCLLGVLVAPGFAAEPVRIWPGLAPGETTDSVGEKQPPIASEIPPVTRVVKIATPTLTVHLAKQPNGTGVLILPGGGFGKVVPDKEGTEAAAWLNRFGVSAFVLSYRTQEDRNLPGWIEPLQDAQRAMALIRNNSAAWQLHKERLGLLGFSAGGQVAARLLCSQGKLSYEPVDAIDDISFRPDFALLIYPWNLYDQHSNALVDGLQVTRNCPPTYLVHTDDDQSSSLGTVLFYAALKRLSIPAELHVYGNGGHGYGMRAVSGSQISTWPTHAEHWLQAMKFVSQ